MSTRLVLHTRSDQISRFIAKLAILTPPSFKTKNFARYLQFSRYFGSGEEEKEEEEKTEMDGNCDKEEECEKGLPDGITILDFFKKLLS